MSKDYSVFKKLCALLLTVLLIIGAIPVALASDITKTTDTVEAPASEDSSASPDEAQLKQGEATGANFVEFAADKPEQIKEAGGVTYVSAKELKKLTLKAAPDAATFNKIKADLDNGKKDNFEITLYKGDDETGDDIKSLCDLSYSADGVVTVVFNVPDDMTGGSKRLVAAYGDETPEKLTEKKFVFVANDPVVGAFKYDGLDESVWTMDSIAVSFTVSSDSPVTVKLEDSTDLSPGEGGTYSFTADKYKKYTVNAYDVFGAKGTGTTEKVKVDTLAPACTQQSIEDKDGHPITAPWTNKTAIGKVYLSDASGIDAKSVIINGEALAEENVVIDKNTAIVTFEIKECKDYTVEFADNVGRTNTVVLSKNLAKVDTLNPKPDEVTFTFKPAEGSVDQVLSLLTFGLYSNTDLKVSADAVMAGGSPQKVTLYSVIDGEEKELTDGVLALDGALDSKSFDLRVEIKDDANNSVKYSLKNDNVKTVVTDGVKELVAETKLGELIISKVAPAFSDSQVEFKDFDNKITGGDGTVFVKGSGKITAKVGETVSGLYRVTASVGGNTVLDTDITDKLSAKPGKTTEYTAGAPIDLQSGEYELIFNAESNSRKNSNPLSVQFVVDNDPPEWSGLIYKDKDSYSSGSIDVDFKLTDVCGVKPGSVTCKDRNGSNVPVTDNGDGTYSFTAAEYGKFTIHAEDNLGNKKDYESDNIKIDNFPPKVNGGFDISDSADTTWTNKDVTVTFKVYDEKVGECAGLNTDCAKAFCDGKEIEGGVTFTPENAANPVSGTCTFVAKEYGHYTVKLTDKVNNEKSYDVGNADTNLKIDKSAPEVTKVEFSGADEKVFGAYNNSESGFTMSVTVKNDPAGYAEHSDFDSLTVLNRGNKPANNITFISEENGEEENTKIFRYTVKCDKTKSLTLDDINLIFKVKDKAGNEGSFCMIENKNIEKIVDGSEMQKGVFDVLSTIATADIQPIKVTGSVKDGTFNGQKLYSAKSLTISSTVTDELAGVSNIKVEYAKISNDAVISNYTTVPLANDITAKAVGPIDYNSEKKDQAIPVKYTLKHSDGTDLTSADSGRYVFRITAVNNAGNDNCEYVDFYLDNTKPEVRKIEVLGDVKAFGKNGIYMNVDEGNPNLIEVTVYDAAPSSGVKSIELKSGSKTVECKGITKNTADEYIAQFVLADNTVFTGLKISVTDNFDQKTEASLTTFEKNIEVNGVALDPDDEDFEIVVRSNTEPFGAKGYDFDFDKENESSVIYRDIDKGKITQTVTNTVSGIKNVKVYLDSETDELSEPVCKINYKPSDAEKYTSAEITVDVTQLNLQTGEHYIWFEATDKCENKYAPVKKVFYIDKTGPSVKSVNFKKHTETDGDKLLNLLTFGAYTNESIEVTVEVIDPQYSSGINADDINLTYKNEKQYSVKSAESAGVKTDGDNKVTKVFVLPAGSDASDSFYNDLKVTVKDVFGNDRKNPEMNNAIVNDKNVVLDGEFDIVASKYKPQISPLSLAQHTGEYAYPESGAPTDSGRFFSNYPELTFTVDDNVSKIQTTKIYVNGEDVTGSCTLTNTGNPSDVLPSDGVFTYPNSDNPDHKVENLSVKLDVTTAKEGLNTISVTAVGNNGEKSESSTTFNLDRTKPVITEFAFDGVNYHNYNRAYQPHDGGVVIDDVYGFFFKDTVTVTVTANDDFNGITGSGIREIRLLTKEQGKSEYDSAYAGTKVNDTQWAFVVPANFKGRIRAYAVDNVYNNHKDYNHDDKFTFAPDQLVVENQSMHNNNSGVRFTYSNTALRDNKNQRLYGSATTITFEAWSTYAGIQKIEYYLQTPKGKVGENTITVDESGKLSDGVDSSTRDINDKGQATNLISRIVKTVQVPYNTNDIVLHVKVTDYAGFYKTDYEKEKLDSNYFIKADPISVDTTAPVIQDITFDRNDGNRVDGGEYYKTSRTATITIRERNFNPNDVKISFQTSAGNRPAVVASTNWNTTYNIDVSNPDDILHVGTVTFTADDDYVMNVDFTDLAKHNAASKKTDKFTIDNIDPVIEISQPGGTYFNTTETVTIIITEHNFYAGSGYLTITQNNTEGDNTTAKGDIPVSNWTSLGNDRYSATITYETDGKYEFSVSFRDKALRDARPQQTTTFYIDKTKGEIKFIDVKTEGAYDDVIAPKINFFDNNYKSCTYVLKRIDYDYGKFTEMKETIIDTFVVTAEETKTGCNVAYENFAKKVDNDGIYILTATVTDLAGNPNSDYVMFSVNRYGSNFLISDPATNALVSENPYTKDAPAIKVKEINVNKTTDATVQINYNESTRDLTKGSDFTTTETGGTGDKWYCCEYTINKNNFDNEGKYIATITSTDHFLNKRSNRNAIVPTEADVNEGEEPETRRCPVEFVVDKTEPVISVSGITTGEYYEEPEKEVVVVCDDTNITKDNFSISFDGKPVDYKVEEEAGSLVARVNLKSDGNSGDRKFDVTVYDKASNEGTKEVKEFRLSATWIARLLHYHLPLVIGIGAGAAALIALAVAMTVRKRKNAEKNG